MYNLCVLCMCRCVQMFVQCSPVHQSDAVAVIYYNVMENGALLWFFVRFLIRRTCSTTASCTGCPSAPTIKRTKGSSPTSAPSRTPRGTCATCSTARNVYVWNTEAGHGVSCVCLCVFFYFLSWLSGCRQKRSPSPSVRRLSWRIKCSCSPGGKTWSPESR